MALCKRMEHLLERVTQVRVKMGKKTNLESELRKKLKSAQERAQSYVNQYSIAMAELCVNPEIELISPSNKSCEICLRRRFHCCEFSPC